MSNVKSVEMNSIDLTLKSSRSQKQDNDDTKFGTKRRDG